MNIELLKYVNGLDDVNTRCFDNDIDRDNFFSPLVNIETTYYPPYYKNKISLSIDDFDIYNTSSPCNYLRIKYSNKYYYYFISSINYINENVYELDITMDTLMTFQCHIMTEDVIIERKHINRYNDDGTINRNYLRENVSNMNLKLVSRTAFDTTKSTDDTTMTLVIRSSKSYTNNTRLQSIRYMPNMLETHYGIVDQYYYFLPLNKSIITDNVFKIYEDDYQQEDTREWSFSALVKFFASETTTISMYLVQGNLLPDCFRTLGNVVHYHGSTISEFSVTYTASEKATITSICLAYSAYHANAGYYSINANIGFETNNKLATLFDKKYIPCLMDSNYYRYSFGDRNNQCTDLIEYYDNDKLSFTYQPVLSGERMYYPTNDKYYQSLMSNDKYYINLIKDNWNEYNAYNSASIGVALGTTALRAFAFGSNTITESKIKEFELLNISKQLGQTYKEPYYLNKNKTALNAYGKSRISSLENQYDYINYRPVANNGIQESSNLASGLAPTLTHMLNAYLAPNTAKTNYDIDATELSKAFEISLSLYCVEDIENVAQYYHRYGNLVMEYCSSQTFTKLINYINTRYYFNYLKLYNVIVKPKDMMISQDILNDIAFRLKTGIRVWNAEVLIPSYKYDNVERSYL